jgi:pimeloyl-ACP methyl ester carboxylesterase
MLSPLLDRRDLLLVDARGTGAFGAIDCPDLQQGQGMLLAAVAMCGTQLGATIDDYGTAAVDDDLDAVRDALGIDRLDLVGISYGAYAAEAYAIRHPDHLRTLVLDAPADPSAGDFWQLGVLHQLLGTPDLICARSPSCTNDVPDATSEIAWLAARLRRAPLEGDSFDASGMPQHVRLDESGLLLDVLQNDSGGFLYQGEIAGAARALRAGDPAPLLRIAAETDGTPFMDSGPADGFSRGLQTAVYCAEWPVLWDESASPAAREGQYAAALAALPGRTLAPFSPGAWRAFLDSGPTGDYCTPWPITRRPTPATGPGLVYPSTPTLVLSGEYDLVVPPAQARAVAGRFPAGQFVRIAKVGHTTLPRSACARALVEQFVLTAAPVDPACAAAFTPAYAVGRFPLTAADATPATQAPHGGDRSTPRERRIVTAAWGAAYDAVQHSFVGPPEATGDALRGGTFRYSFGTDQECVRLDGARFTTDVAVSGLTGYRYTDGTTDTRLLLRVHGRLIGALRIQGQLFPHTQPLSVTGTLDGNRVALLVPSA